MIDDDRYKPVVSDIEPEPTDPRYDHDAYTL